MAEKIIFIAILYLGHGNLLVFVSLKKINVMKNFFCANDL